MVYTSSDISNTPEPSTNPTAVIKYPNSIAQTRATIITTDIAGVSPLTAEHLQQWRRDVKRALGYGRVIEKFINNPLLSPSSDENIERWEDDRRTVAIWVSKAAGNDLQHIVAPFLRTGDPDKMWKALMAIYKIPSPTPRFRYYKKILDIKLDTDQSFETLLQSSASIFGDLYRLAPMAMTAKNVMEEMVIMAVSQLIPPTSVTASRVECSRVSFVGVVVESSLNYSRLHKTIEDLVYCCLQLSCCQVAFDHKPTLRPR
jgi:hypothetical protein